MYHDAVVEAAVTVHRHRSRPAAAASTQAVPQRILQEYQLHRVVDFLLTGRDGAASAESTTLAPPATATHGEDSAEKPTNGCAASCCQCRTSSATRASTAPYVRVALQFPDELLNDAVAVVSGLQDLLVSDPRYAAAMSAKFEADGVPAGANSSNASDSVKPAPLRAAAGAAVGARPPQMDNPHRPEGVVRLFVLADNTFGSCCPDEITAQHYMTDCIVHFGDACMSRSTRLPVLYVQPAFHFDALMEAEASSGGTAEARAVQQQQPQGGPALLQAEADVVLGIVERVSATLRRRLTAWWAEEGDGGSIESCTVAPRLTVVGTYPTKPAMQAAELCWNAEGAVERRRAIGDAVVTVDWPRYEERNGILPIAQDHTRAAEASAEATATATVSQSPAVEDADWLVNGVRFHRLCKSQSTAQEVQFFLFFGAAGSAALVHVLTAEQYNEFHYTDACREFVGWDAGDDECAVPVVTVVNNTFGMDAVDGEAERAVVQTMTQAAALDEDASATLKGCVSKWLSAVLADNVSTLLTGDYVVAQQALQRRVRQRAFNIESVRASTAIGVLVASLAIEGYYELTQQLHQLIRAYGKRSYVIYVGHLNEFKLANFVDTVDCFVAVACPYSRQSHFPEKRDNFMKPIVSPAELLVALTTSDDTAGDALYGMAAVYTTSFETALHVLREAVRTRKAEIASRASGDAESQQRRRDEEERWASSGVLVRAGGAGGGALTVQESSQGALARLYEREYVGLDPRIGQTAVQTEVLDGLHGIARGYATEREEQHAEPPVSQYK